MTTAYILAIEVGTTRVQVSAMNEAGTIVARASSPVPLLHPQPDWVEQDATTIWQATQASLSELMSGDIRPTQVHAIGITNQRETILVWDKNTGLPVYNALSWQSQQSSAIVEQMRGAGHDTLIHERTGLRLDPYFSATKLRWILNQVPGADQRAAAGELLAGTLDTWLTWQLTRGKVFVTDCTNAARTMLFDLHKMDWDADILDCLNIPRVMLPDVVANDTVVGMTSKRRFFNHAVPIAALIGDQQAALFGQLALQKGAAVTTYGTGAFMMMNTGETAQLADNGLLTTVAYSACGQTVYALEGASMIAGSAVAWLRDNMHLLRSAAESATAARVASGDDDVYVVPGTQEQGVRSAASRGRGAIYGVGQATTREDMVKAVLQSIAYQTRDVLGMMQIATGLTVGALRAGGTAARNDYLMQFQADVLNLPVMRAADVDTTARGAAYLAGLASGFWTDVDALRLLPVDNAGFIPSMTNDRRSMLYAGWQDAVAATRYYENRRQSR